ncbi:MAG: glycoside hydrolase family 18 protein, partial [Clostridia bacterium]|nr:glycoside hydrolase family 18 protein [Clostridia bacterium]
AGDQLSGESAINHLVAQGVPKEKLVLGAAAYGRCWRQVQGGGSGLGQRAGTSGNKTYTYAQLKDMMKDYEAYWDEQAKAPYLFDGSQFISYEDARSARAKGEYAKANGLMGVMLWEYGKDDGELIKALYEGLQ